MAQIRADEISRVLLAEIENFDAVANVAETGSVISVGDGIARIYGLRKCHGRRTGGIRLRRPSASR